MDIGFRKAEVADAELLVGIYDAAFYDDYVRYGECPAYGRTKEMMAQSILDYPKYLILCDGRPVGCVSCKETEPGTCEIGCLCVIPAFQGKGIGTAGNIRQGILAIRINGLRSAENGITSMKKVIWNPIVTATDIGFLLAEHGTRITVTECGRRTV